MRYSIVIFLIASSVVMRSVSFLPLFADAAMQMVPASACADIPRLAAEAEDRIPDSPDERVRWTETFYHEAALGYGFAERFGYGNGQVDFTRWERRRGVLDPIGGSPWWRAVNALLMRDMFEARYIHEAGLDACGGSSASVDTWLAYLNQPGSQTWYVAHNASITAGYERYADLASAESLAEQIVMANTLYRVTLADQMTTAPDALIVSVSDPRGAAVGLITALEPFYPKDYPLSDKQAADAAMLYLLEGNNIAYAGANRLSVSAYLLAHGFTLKEVAEMQPAFNLYREMFPWFVP